MTAKIMLVNVLLVIVGGTAFFSCFRDEKVTPPKSKMELITARPWKRLALTSEPAYDWNDNGVFDTDVLKTMFACEKDNLEIFRVDGIFEHHEGLTKCNESDPQKWTGTWMFADNDNKMIMDGTDEYIITELSTIFLKYQSTFVEKGITYTHKETWGH